MAHVERSVHSRAPGDPSRPAHRGNTAETARAHLLTNVLRALEDEPAAAVRERLVTQAFDYVDTVFVTHPGGELAGWVPLVKLLAAPATATMKELCVGPAPAVHPETDQERAATLALHHGMSAVAVVDAGRRLIGVVPPETLLEVLRHEHVEDLHRLSGLRRSTSRVRATLEAPPARRARERLPWLLVGLAGSTIAAFVMAQFEHTLAANLAIAFFVPGIVYLADAVGTQTEAIAVRGLSLSHLPIAMALGAEVRTGALIGIILGAIAFAGIWLVLGQADLAAAVAIALVAASATATAIGLALPWLLARLRYDPALGSGPVATVIQDVLSLTIYFWVAQILVR